MVESVVALLVGRVEGFVERVDEGLACFELETERRGTEGPASVDNSLLTSVAIGFRPTALSLFDLLTLGTVGANVNLSTPPKVLERLSTTGRSSSMDIGKVVGSARLASAAHVPPLSVDFLSGASI